MLGLDLECHVFWNHASFEKTVNQLAVHDAFDIASL